jgi:DNA-binding phage protein
MIVLTTTPEQKVEVHKIAAKMAESGLSAEFVSKAADLALIYEGAFDLMVLWSEEEDKSERTQIVADLQDEIDSHVEVLSEPIKKPKIEFKDLDSVAKKIIDFKKKLRDKVDRWGGISKLARVTGIPQPSLSRFFQTASMPRKTTLYRIADALELSEKEIVFDWVS